MAAGMPCGGRDRRRHEDRDRGPSGLAVGSVSWSVGWSERWQRDVGYGVRAVCDHPLCHEPIDRGLAYICGGEIHGGEHGCGLFFCHEHLRYAERCSQLCPACEGRRKPYKAKADVVQWVQHKLNDPSWAEWRLENAELVDKLREAVLSALVVIPQVLKP